MDLLMRKHMWPTRCLMALALLVAGASAEAAPDQASEYDIKAAMLLKLPAFIAWPAPRPDGQQISTASSLSDSAANRPLMVGVLGSDPFGDGLTSLAKRATVNDRPVQVQRVALDSLPSEGVLFISASESGRLADVLAKAGNSPLLTVSDIAGFAESGGMIELEMQDRKVSLRINKKAIEEAGLSASSKLLALARVVLFNEGEGKP